VQISHDATERTLSASRRRGGDALRNIQSRDVLVVQGWPNHRTHTESRKHRCVCEIEIALKTKYLWVGSRYRAARDTGTHITTNSGILRN